MDVDVDHTLDAKGLNCPMPVVKTKEAIDDVGDGEVLEVLATDPGAEEDLQSFASRTGNEYIGCEDQGDDVLALYLRRNA